MSLITRSSSLGPFLSATTQVVPSLLRPLIPAVVTTSQKIVTEPQPEVLRHFTLASRLVSGPIKAVTGLAVTSQVRYAHTDIQVPDFSAYRREGVKDSSAISRATDGSRKAFTYLVVAGGSVAGAYAGKTLATEFVASMSASADVLAMAKIEVKLGEIAEGKSATFKWRNKPLFIRHRTAEEIEREEAVDPTTLRDQQHDNERVQKPEWLVLLGVCTHLGCVPIANSGDYGGYYCPCHGSHYDASGRIRKGPAPLNLEVPQYSFMDEETLVVG